MRTPTNHSSVLNIPHHVLAALLLLVGAGCSAHSTDKGTSDELKRALSARAVEPSGVTIPFTLNREIRQWAHDLAPPSLPAEEKLDRLLQGLLDSKELELEYSWGYTGTATEVYQSRRANCLAFTNLFLGMAREVGVPVYFLAVETETFRKEGDFVVVSDHIAVGYGDGQLIRSFDFSERESGKLRRVRRISDLTAISMYHSNRGAELMQEGDLAESLRWLRTAVALEPGLPKIWVNLGVARRRVGDLDGAESAYRRAMELNPTTYSAYQNLAALLRTTDREAEARELEGALGAVPHRNPFTYLSLGDMSLRMGRLEEARRFYRRAVHLSSEDADSYAALGTLAVVTGDLERARRLLRKAQKIDHASERAARLARMISDDQS